MRPWTDFPRTKDKLAIVGFSETSRELAPYDDPDYEIWGLNEEHAFPWMKRFDRWFQMHPHWDYTRENNLNCPNHYMWLQNISGTCVFCKGTGIAPNVKDKVEKCKFCTDGVYTPNLREGVIIYMREEHDEIPLSIKFPLEDATKVLAPYLDYPYFTSTSAYMLALAMMMGFKEIYLYGFEMGTLTEYHYQRACMEYLIGLAHGRGIKVVVPENCGLLHGTLYSYDTMHIGYRQQLEMRKSFLLKQLKTEEEKRVHWEGRLEAFKEMEVPMEKMTEQSKKYVTQVNLCNNIRGAIAEVENLTKLYDSYYLGGKDDFQNERDYTKAGYESQKAA